MAKITIFKCIFIIYLAMIMVCAECAVGVQLAAQAQEKDYDSITWQDVNKKREERDEKNFFSKTYWWMFKRHKEETYQGDEIDVVQTASNVDLEDNDSPIKFVHVTSS